MDRRPPPSPLPVRADRAAGRAAGPGFRSLRPHLENSILGITRWTIHTAGYGAHPGSPGSELRPLVEISYGRIAKVAAGSSTWSSSTASNSFWTVSLGVRLGFGGGIHRMGRYGAASDGDSSHQHRDQR